MEFNGLEKNKSVYSINIKNLHLENYKKFDHNLEHAHIYENLYKFIFDPILNNSKNIKTMKDLKFENFLENLLKSECPLNEFLNESNYKNAINKLNFISNSEFNFDEILKIYDYKKLDEIIKKCNEEMENNKKINSTLMYTISALYDVRNEIIKNYYRFVKVCLLNTLKENKEVPLCYYDHHNIIEMFSQKLLDSEIILNYYTYTNEEISIDCKNKKIEMRTFYIDINHYDHLIHSIQFLETRTD